MLYLDTSIVVTSLTSEVETVAVQTWLRGHAAIVHAISSWTITELSSALSIKRRLGQMGEDEWIETTAVFDAALAEGLRIIPVEGSDFLTAARFADRHDLGLRAADALHLAIAYRVGTTLCTRDRRQAEAGAALGIATKLLA